jgi:type IV pilus assembly protein PilA
MAKRDEGFTLIELLVVMIIIGILAAIAIPVFLNQRAKGRDTSTKADVSTIGKEIATYFVDGTGGAVTPLVIGAGGGANTLKLTDTATPAYASGDLKLSTGTALSAGALGFTPNPVSGNWCVGLTNPAGVVDSYKYSSAAGLQPGTCP